MDQLPGRHPLSVRETDFVADPPVTTPPDPLPTDRLPVATIAGVVIDPLARRSDERGGLVELLTVRDGVAPIVHVYQVFAAPRSVRAWVFHRDQDDRLAFTHGAFKVVLYDIRPESPTAGVLDVLEVGDVAPCRITLPPRVVHGVQNIGGPATFVNMPTRAYDHAKPDKCRLPPGDPRIPYRFG